MCEQMLVVRVGKLGKIVVVFTGAAAVKIDSLPTRGAMEPTVDHVTVDQVVEICGCSREAAVRAVEAAGPGGADLAVELVLSMMSTPPPRSEHTDSLIDAPQKLVCLVRDDLQMGAGKVAAQVGHACLGATRAMRSKSGGSEQLAKWEHSGEAIIVLSVRDLAELEEHLDRAAAINLPICKIADAGRTEVAAGSVTVGAIGPALVGAIDAITGELSLLS